MNADAGRGRHALRPVGVVMLLRWLGVGGTQRQALALSRELIAQGATVCILTRRAPRTPGHERIDGVPVYHVGLPARGRLGALSFFFGALSWMFRHRRDFDVIHACNLPSGLTAAILGPLLRKPVLVKLPNGTILRDFHRRAFGRFRFSLLRRNVDRFLALTGEIEEALVSASIPRDRIVRMPNGVGVGLRRKDSGALPSLRSALGLEPTHRIAIYVGTLLPIKGLDWLLAVWKAVSTREPAARLLLVGDGPTRARLEAFAQRLGLADSVRFLGEHQNVHPYLDASDLFILPSRREGMSNALLEAMSHGLPAVATDIPGNREVIDDGGDGFLVPWGDDRALTRAIVRLVHDPALGALLGQRARSKVEALFALPAVATRHLDLYRALLAGPDAPAAHPRPERIRSGSRVADALPGSNPRM